MTSYLPQGTQKHNGLRSWIYSASKTRLLSNKLGVKDIVLLCIRIVLIKTVMKLLKAVDLDQRV